MSCPGGLPTFFPLALPAPVVEGEIRVELQRADMTVKIVWSALAAQRLRGLVAAGQ